VQLLPVVLSIPPLHFYSEASAAQHPAASAEPQQSFGASSAQHGFGQGIGQGLSQSPSPAQHGLGQSSVQGVFGQSVDSACVAIIWGFAAVDAIIGQPVPAAGQHPAFAGASVAVGLLFA